MSNTKQVEIYYRYDDADEYQFVPTPLINMSSTLNQTEQGSGLSVTTNMTLNGYFIPSGADNDYDRFDLLRVEQDKLKDVFGENFKNFRMISNDDTSTNISVYPKINSIEFPEDMWTDKMDFSISLSYDEPASGVIGNVKSFTENWSYQENEDRTHAVTHDIAAVGLNLTGSDAFTNAKDLVVSRSISDETLPAQYAFFISPYTENDPYDDREYNISGIYEKTRSEMVDEIGGSYSLSERWTLHYQPWIHDVTTEYAYSYIPVLNIETSGTSINGKITGLRTAESGAWETANWGWTGLSASGIKDWVGWENDNSLGFPRSNSKTMTENRILGTIDYSLVWEPVGTSGVKSVEISERETDPRLLEVVLPAPFRNAGPIVQPLGTTTEGRRDIVGGISFSNYEVMNASGLYDFTDGEEAFMKDVCNGVIRTQFPDIVTHEALTIEQQLADSNYGVLEKNFGYANNLHTKDATFNLSFRQIVALSGVIRTDRLEF